MIRPMNACLLAHDEMSPAQRRAFREMGAVVSEFPMNEETAREARNAGEHTILGAPNVVRGGSHNGALNAADAVIGGFCSVLTSDYYYPAPLQAAFKLYKDHDVALGEAWNLLSKNAAESANLDDRGVIAPGKRADLVLVDDSDPSHPRVVACFVEGKKSMTGSRGVTKRVSGKLFIRGMTGWLCNEASPF
jgi:alpha-D-ribose 1-methylphosphonate 5-triphosphate diphosphatase